MVRRAETRESHHQEAEPQIIQTDLEGSFLEAAESLIAAIGGQSADLDSFVNELLERLRADQPDGNVRLLLGSDPSAVNRIETAVRVLAQARVPARSVHGVLLEADNRDAPLRHWLEVYDRGEWKPYSLLTGAEGIPDDWLAWWRGPDPLGEVQGGQHLEVATIIATCWPAAQPAWPRLGRPGVTSGPGHRCTTGVPIKCSSGQTTS